MSTNKRKALFCKIIGVDNQCFVKSVSTAFNLELTLLLLSSIILMSYLEEVFSRAKLEDITYRILDFFDNLLDFFDNHLDYLNN